MNLSTFIVTRKNGQTAAYRPEVFDKALTMSMTTPKTGEERAQIPWNTVKAYRTALPLGVMQFRRDNQDIALWSITECYNHILRNDNRDEVEMVQLPNIDITRFHKTKSTFLNQEVIDKLGIAEDVENLTYKLVAPEEADLICYSRQSIKDNKNLGGYRAGFVSMLRSATQTFDILKICLWFDQGLSGYCSNLGALLMTYDADLMIYDLSRAFRKAVEMSHVLLMCYNLNVRLYMMGDDISEGSGLIMALIMSVFTEYDLSTKQTSLSNEHEDIVKALLGLIEYTKLADEVLKTFQLTRFVGRAPYLLKLKQKCKAIIENKDAKNKANKPKYSTEQIKTARACLKLLETTV